MVASRPSSPQGRPLRANWNPHLQLNFDQLSPARLDTSFDLTRDSTRAPSFDLLVLGCGGGPIETNLSCYLVKSQQTSWTTGCAALEGGSTIGAIAALVEKFPHSFAGFDLGIGVDDSEEAREFVGVGRDGGGKSAGKVWELIKSFSVTHAHLDHIAGLVISSAAVQLAAKNVYGLPSTIKNLESVMDFGVWPNLGTRDTQGCMRGKAYVWQEIDSSESTMAETESLPSTPQEGEMASESRYPLAEALTSTAIQISHGTDPAHSTASSKESYVSTAFFVRNELTKDEFLFYGDVEPDSISCDPRTRKVWEQAAKKIVDQRLNVIFLECSYPSSQPKDKLFGHLSPPFVLEELQVLADLVQEERQRRNLDKATKPLEGIFVIIQHIKDDIFTAESPTSSAAKTSSSAATTSVPAPSMKPNLPKPPPLELVTTKRASDAESNLPFSPLSMSPPIATVALRRPSVQLSQFSFPASSTSSSPGAGRNGSSRSSSPFGSPYASPSSRRSSLYPPTSTTSPSLLASPSPSKRHSISHFGTTSPNAQRKSSLSTSSTLSAPADPVVTTSSSVGPEQNKADEKGDHERGSKVIYRSRENEVEGMGDGEHDEEDDDEAEDSTIEMVEETVHERIERELNELEQNDFNLGVQFVIARQGMRLKF